MLARSVEPAGGEAAHGGTGHACLNCGTALTGDYCHRCGQPAHVHRSLHAFFHDLLHSVLHLEGKTWRTLPMLAFKPGELTRRYIAGERARFVSPMALFLFSVFLMFAVFSWVGGPFATNSTMQKAAQQESLQDVEAELAEARGALKEAETELAAAKAAGESTRSGEGDVIAARSEVAVLANAVRVAKAATPSPPTKATGTVKQADTLEDGVKQIDLETGFPPLDGALAHITENPKLTLYKLQSNAYKFSWALIPLSVPLVWSLFFWKRRFKLYDHTVFVTYSIAAMSLGVILLSLLRPLGLGEGFAEAAIAFLPPIHIYKQVKGAYDLSRFSALWRTAMLILFAFIACTWFFTMLLGIGALG